MSTAETGRIQRLHIPRMFLNLLKEGRPPDETLDHTAEETSTDGPTASRIAGLAGNEHRRPARKPVIIVAMDDSKESVGAADWATEMARRIKASVLLVHAVQLNLTSYGPANPAWLKAGLRQEAMTRAEPIMTRAQASGVAMTSAVEEGAPASVILRAASRWQAQVIVMAGPKPGFFTWLFGGHTVEKVIRDAKCPVIVLEASR